MITPRAIEFKCGCVFRDEDTDGQEDWSYIADTSKCTQQHEGGLISMRYSAIDYGGEYVDPPTTARQMRRLRQRDT